MNGNKFRYGLIGGLLIGLGALMGGCPQTVCGDSASLLSAAQKALGSQLTTISPGEVKLVVDTASQEFGTGVELPCLEAAVIVDIIRQNDLKSIEDLRAALENPSSLDITPAQLETLQKFADSVTGN